jgi:predicted nucleotidyltransferase
MASKLTKRELKALIDAMQDHNIAWSSIYLFGSTAKGHATRHSDRDFCIVLPDREKKLGRREIKLNAQLGFSGYNFDVIFTTATEFRKNRLSPILNEIRTTGIQVA